MPSEVNAHPHTSQGVAVVHNGIIENFQALRAELVGCGHAFTTQTDTEVVPHLVSALMARGLGPREAALAAVRRLEGAFALVMLFEGEPDLLIVARKGSPLAIGHGSGEMFVGSDALALAPLTERIQYLEEGDVAFLTRRGATVVDSAGRPVERAIVQTAFSGALIGKGNHRHFMEKEIFEQPAVLGDTLRAFADPADHRIVLPPLPFDAASLPRLAAIACGTASYACLVAKYWIEQLAGLPVDWDIGSEFRYRATPLVPGQAGLFVSQSGETADTLAAMRHLRGQGHRALAVVNVPESTLAREADAMVRTLAGPEIGVASTKAFTTQLATLACLAIGLARARGRLAPAREAELIQALDEIPARVLQVLEKDGEIRDIAHGLTTARDVLYIGRGTVLRHRPRGGPEAQGDQLHPRRGLCRGRAQARAHRADRRGGPDHRPGPARPLVRQDRLEPAGGRRPRRQGGPALRRPRGGRARRVRLEDRDPADRRPLRGADPLCRAGPAPGLPHRRAQGHRRRPAAQPREERHGGVTTRRW